MTRMLAGGAVGLRRREPSGSQPLIHSTTLARAADRPRRLLERLELDQQLVDDPGDALAVARAGAALAADGVELLDEADGAALAAGLATELLEVGADLAVRLPVEHGLERRGGDEQEGHAGLGGHGLGHVGLAGARRALEQDGLPGGAAHLLVEGPVGEEEVEGLGDLLDQSLGATHVVEAHGELVGPVEDVGGPARAEQRHDHHEAEEDDESERQQVGGEGGRDRGGGERRPRRQHVTGHERHGDEAEDEGDALQPGRARLRLVGPDVGGRHAGHPGAGQRAEAVRGTTACDRWTDPGRSACRPASSIRRGARCPVAPWRRSCRRPGGRCGLRFLADGPWRSPPRPDLDPGRRPTATPSTGNL